MSFAGPRHALYNQEDHITLRWDYELHKLLSGLAFWAQVNERNNLTITEKVILEVEYVQKNHFGLI